MLNNDQKIIVAAKATSKIADTLKKQGIGINEGNYTFDFTLHFSGAFRKKPDTLYTPTVKIPWHRVAMVLLQRSGATKESAIRLIDKIYKGELQVDDKQIDEIKTEYQKRIGLEKQSRVGALTFSQLKVEILEAEAKETKEAVA
ncbi:hypothetical protein D6827_01990 [Candidatus Parcubacteria bacterium]|nr:MAG: hypothetical protein D6827_01990 [Candidatus Parcubacteria bacterium]